VTCPGPEIRPGGRGNPAPHDFGVGWVIFNQENNGGLAFHAGGFHFFDGGLIELVGGGFSATRT